MANGNKFSGGQARNYGLVDGQISQSADSFNVTAWVGIHQDYSRDSYTYYGYLDGTYWASWSRPSKGTHWSSAKTFSYPKLHYPVGNKITATVTTQGGTSTANYWFTIPAKDSYFVYLTIDKGQSYDNIEAQEDETTALKLTKWYNETLTLPTTTPIRTGYTFLGWSKDKIQPGAEITYNGSWTMPAQWEANTYKVKFNLNQGTWPLPEYIERTYDKEFSIPSQIPTRKYYKFLGWTTTANSNTPQYISGVQLKENPANDITLYACWELQSVNIYVYKPSHVIWDNVLNRFTYGYGDPIVEQGVINTNFKLHDLSSDVIRYEATGKMLDNPQEQFIHYGESGIGRTELPITQLDNPYYVYMEIRENIFSYLELTTKKLDWVKETYTQDEYVDYLTTNDPSKLKKSDKTNVCMVAFIFNNRKPSETDTTVDVSKVRLVFQKKYGTAIDVHTE